MTDAQIDAINAERNRRKKNLLHNLAAMVATAIWEDHVATHRTAADNYPYTPQTMGGHDIRGMLREERDKIEAQIFRKLTTRMRRRYAGQLMFVHAKNLTIVGFSTFWPFDHEQYRNVQMLCYRMPKVVGNSKPELMWTMQDVVASE